jgi:hypothetical protein
MMASRGMGAIRSSKMPKGVRKARRDDTDFTEYAKGGKVKRFDEGGEVESSKSNTDNISENDKDTKFSAKPLGVMLSKDQKAILGRLLASKKIDNDSELSAYLDAGLSKASGDRLRANLGGIGVNYTRRFNEGGSVGLYANINAKRKRIAAGSKEKMRKPGSKGAPTAQAFINSAKTAKK